MVSFLLPGMMTVALAWRFRPTARGRQLQYRHQHDRETEREAGTKNATMAVGCAVLACLVFVFLSGAGSYYTTSRLDIIV